MKFPDEGVFHPQELRHFGVAMETNPELLNNLLSIKWHLGNPLTTSNVAPEKSRIRFLRLPGGIFLKMLFWKIYDFSRITSNRHKCFEKDLFTIVVAMSTESYFSLHFC